MIIQIDRNLLFSTFGVECFSQLEQSTQSMAPSMVEYYLSDLATSNSDSFYLNRSNIQQTIFLDEYSLYLDYNDETYLEFLQKETEYETESLW